jgi:hypothetical protein
VSGSVAVGLLAVAPLAFGWKAAKGAMVFSLQYAEGPSAFAPHANDEAARQFMDSSSLIQQLDQGLHSFAESARDVNVYFWIAALIVFVLVARHNAFK